MLARFLCGRILVAPNIMTHRWKEEIKGSNMRYYLDQESCVKSDYEALWCIFG
jgi:hypothetical protein